MLLVMPFILGTRTHHRKVKVTPSCLTLCDPVDYTIHGILQARILEWVASSLLQGIFPTQGLDPGLPHCRWVLYQLSHHGSARKLECVAYPFSSGSSQPRNRTRVSWIVGRFFTNWATREARIIITYHIPTLDILIFLVPFETMLGFCLSVVLSFKVLTMIPRIYPCPFFFSLVNYTIDMSLG